ncbi:Protein Wnt, partial [Operophtera brumata]
MGLLEFEKWSNQPDLFTESSRLCSSLSLTPGQRRVCRRHKEHMPVVSAGVRRGIEECQYQFSSRRWNCTVTEDGTVFGPLTLIAGVSLSVSRACRDGSLSSCSCSRATRPKHLHSEWVWGGCGDNLEYGYKFTESFVDIRERERKVKRGSREQGRQLMNRHNNEAGRRGSMGTTGRECNRTSSGLDGCALLCCGRGYNTKKIIVKERCNCKFHWCCRVECNTCIKAVEVYTCK